MCLWSDVDEALAAWMGDTFHLLRREWNDGSSHTKPKSNHLSCPVVTIGNILVASFQICLMHALYNQAQSYKELDFILFTLFHLFYFDHFHKSANIEHMIFSKGCKQFHHSADSTVSVVFTTNEFRVFTFLLSSMLLHWISSYLHLCVCLL